MDSSSQLRHQLAADRMASLRRSAEHGPPSSLRRAVGSGLVRLGLRLGYPGSVPPFLSELGIEAGRATTAATRPVATSRTGGR